MEVKTARHVRIAILIVCVCLGFLVLFAAPMPYGPTFGLFLVVFGLWFSRFVYLRLVPPSSRLQNWHKRQLDEE